MSIRRESLCINTGKHVFKYGKTKNMNKVLCTNGLYLLHVKFIDEYTVIRIGKSVYSR